MTTQKKTTKKKENPFVKDIQKELITLSTIVQAFESFDEESRNRNMRYLLDRFRKYVPPQN